MNNKIAIAFVTISWSMSSLAAGAATIESPAENPPNVLFIFIDDLRPQLGAYGFDDMHTPGLDRIAEHGLIFRRAYSHWPACGPSRASILSGLRPDSTNTYHGGQIVQSTTVDAASMPKLFKDNGYHTYSVGKIYHHRDADLDGWSETPWHPDSVADNWQGYATQESADLRQRLWQEAMENDPDIQLYQINGRAIEAASLPDAAYGDGKTTDKAIQVLRDNANKPFFLAVGFEKPHFPFAAPQRYWDLYQRKAFHPTSAAARPLGSTGIPYLYSELHQYYGIPEDRALTEGEIRELLHGYHACVSFIDAQVGKLLDELARLSLTENTIIVLMSDHGMQLGEQAVWGKHSLYERSLHTPLIISVPGQESAGGVTDAIVEHVDVYPSLADLAGLQPPENLDGTSFAPLLHDPDMAWKESALSQYQHFKDPYKDIMGYSLRTDQYRYTEWQDGRSPNSIFARELYDLKYDPDEKSNLAGDPGYAKTVEELSVEISRAGGKQ